MTANRLALSAKKLIAERAQLAAREADLVDDMDSYLRESSAKDFARALEFSASYVSDVRNGRRNLSDAALARLAGLK